VRRMDVVRFSCNERLGLPLFVVAEAVAAEYGGGDKPRSLIRYRCSQTRGREEL